MSVFKLGRGYGDITITGGRLSITLMQSINSDIVARVNYINIGNVVTITSTIIPMKDGYEMDDYSKWGKFILSRYENAVNDINVRDIQETILRTLQWI